MPSKPKKTEAAPAPAPTMSALASLKAAISSKPGADSVPVNAALAAQMSDPAIAGATRKGKSGAVYLGTDPKVLKDAREAAEIKKKMSGLATDFAVLQRSLRDYGIEKRQKYNNVYRTEVTTVNVPYTVEAPKDENSDTPGVETRHIQITCSNKYSVADDAILGGQDTLGDWFGKLFVVEETKVLRASAEEMVRGILSDGGITGDDLQRAMDALFETKKSVKTVEAYERLEAEAPEEIKAFLSQSVTRQEPSLKFPDES